MYDKERQDRLRRLWRMYWEECDRREAAYREEHGIPDEEEYVWGYERPHFPEVLRGLTCGAKTRKGAPCKMTGLYRSGRCKFHGGLSTGPKTEEGKRKAAENGKKAAKLTTSEAESMKG